jgi:phosphoenolpyruvate synthase/pyruvate phosphate dikinase
MGQDHDFIHRFEQPNNGSVSFVGGKNASLGEMIGTLEDHFGLSGDLG